MNSQHLAIFHQVVREESFSKVADHRNMSPSSISRIIKQMENELGFELFLRTTRQIQLTKPGERYYENTLDILKQLDLAKEEALDEQQALKGRLSLTLPMDFGEEWVLPLMGEFHARYPEIQLDLHITNRLVDLRKEHMDIGIRLGQLGDDQLVAKPLMQMQFSVYAHPHFIRQHTLDKASIETLAAAPWIHYLPSSRVFYRQGERSGALQLNAFHRVSSAIQAKHLAQAKLGLVLLPDWMMQQAAHLTQLLPSVRFSPSEQPADNQAWIIYPGHTRLSQKAQVWRDFILEKIKQTAG
jgi:DNA-binding transcriptional LysR family regulator